MNVSIAGNSGGTDCSILGKALNLVFAGAKRESGRLCHRCQQGGAEAGGGGVGGGGVTVFDKNTS